MSGRMPSVAALGGASTSTTGKIARTPGMPFSRGASAALMSTEKPFHSVSYTKRSFMATPA